MQLFFKDNLNSYLDEITYLNNKYILIYILIVQFYV